jgi:carboxyl-terminal processing protease
MPAEKAGIKPGDKILRINEKETGELSLDEAVSNIRGEKGTNVKLTIISKEDNTPREVEITRGNIDVKSVKWEMKDDNIAYIRLNTFSEDTVKEFTQVAREIKESNAQKIILDVRGNPGGYLGSAVDIGGFFLPIGSLVAREDFGGKRSAIDYSTKNNPVLDNYPMVILINQGSASAAEILAGALNELKGVKLIGERTFGKGSVQEFLPLSDGSNLKVTVAQWLTPQGKVINKEGIHPEIEIGFTEEDILSENDVQLTKAIEVLKEM